MSVLLHFIYILFAVVGFVVQNGFDSSVFSAANALWLLVVKPAVVRKQIRSISEQMENYENKLISIELVDRQLERLTEKIKDYSELNFKLHEICRRIC